MSSQPLIRWSGIALVLGGLIQIVTTQLENL